MREFNKFGYDFVIKKAQKGYTCYSLKWNLKVNGSEAITIKECMKTAIDILNDAGEEKTKSAFFNHRNRVVKSRLFDKLMPYFKSIFGFTAPVCRISLMLGTKSIDAIRFDKLVNTPAGISTYNYVENTYGIKALNLLKKLI